MTKEERKAKLTDEFQTLKDVNAALISAAMICNRLEATNFYLHKLADCVQNGKLETREFIGRDPEELPF